MDPQAANLFANTAIVFVAGTLVFFLLLSRAEIMEVWVEIARNTRRDPGGTRYPGLSFFGFVFRLAAYIVLTLTLLVTVAMGLGMVPTLGFDLQGWRVAPPAERPTRHQPPADLPASPEPEAAASTASQPMSPFATRSDFPAAGTIPQRGD